jgi:hypothetical protein
MRLSNAYGIRPDGSEITECKLSLLSKLNAEDNKRKREREREREGGEGKGRKNEEKL